MKLRLIASDTEKLTTTKFDNVIARKNYLQKLQTIAIWRCSGAVPLWNNF